SGWGPHRSLQDGLNNPLESRVPQSLNPFGTGSEKRHPILRFVAEPDNLERALALDDAVFWGSLPMLSEADDGEIRRLTDSLRQRHLTRCIDLRMRAEAELPHKEGEPREQRQARIKVICDAVAGELKSRESEKPGGPVRFLVDQYARNPYKRFQDSKTPLNQILLRAGEGAPRDIAEFSPVIASAEPFNLCRAYVFRDDTEATSEIENVMRTKFAEAVDGAS
ncbi:hypothetical protein ACFPOB_26950, partial [Bosea eneae]